VFTAGALATSRNEGINKHVKRGLSKASSLVKVIHNLILRVEYQRDKSLFQDTFADMPFKEMVTSTIRSFALAYGVVLLQCSDYAVGRFCQQASLGVSAYKGPVVVQGNGAEDSLECELEGDANTTFDATETLDKGDSVRSSSVNQFIVENVLDGDYVCYAVQRQEGAFSHVPPHIVVLYDRDHTATSHIQYLKFFCTCGFSTR
jgi:hypothetical protein